MGGVLPGFFIRVKSGSCLGTLGNANAQGCKNGSSEKSAWKTDRETLRNLIDSLSTFTSVGKYVWERGIGVKRVI